MVRYVHLLIAVPFAFALVLANADGASARGSCGVVEQRLGACTTGSSDGTRVNVNGTKSRENRAEMEATGPAAASARPLNDEELLGLLDEICFGAGTCNVRSAVTLNPLIPTQPADDAEAAEPAQIVTITDLARFLPATATLHAEPNGWAVVGVPANFWVDVSPVTVSAPLFDDTAQVRFTPQAFRFDYGDGTVRTSSAPGASWDALGAEELTATPTSHVYAARGDHRATVTVVYSAQYRFADGPWIAVAGAISGSTPPQRELVVVERTALTVPA